MTKKNKQKKKLAIQPVNQANSKAIEGTRSTSKNWYGILVACIAFLLYANTLGHQYALDDASVITDNYVVKKGASSIGTIFTTNYRYGYWNSTGTLYRPVSLAVFALVWQISPDNPFILHLINILSFAFTGFLLFHFLSKIWSSLHPFLLLAMSLLFVAHPIHVEVVANIKSLDEILGLLFSILALSQLVDYLQNDNNKHLFLAFLAYLTALFSKENTITLLAVFPILVYYLSPGNWTKQLAKTSVFIFAAVIYLGARYAVLKVQTIENVSPLDNLLMATDTNMSWYATAFYLMGKYLWTLVFPLSLGSDFGYSQIPSQSFTSPMVFVSALTYIGLFVFAIWQGLKRNKIAFGILFFLITFSIFTNLFITIGSSYGERFLYMPSLGYSMAIVALLYQLLGKEVDYVNFRKENTLFLGCIGVLLLFYAGRTVVRNSDWYDSYTLYSKDIQTAPNSAKLNYHLGLEQVKKALAEKIPDRQVKYQQSAFASFRKALELYPNYGDAYGQLGLAFYRQKQYPQALTNYEKALDYGPDAKIYSNMGAIYFAQKNLAKAEEVYLKAIKIDPRFVDARLNLGSVYAQTGRLDEAMIQFQTGLEYAPNHPTLLTYLGYIYRDKGNPTKSKEYLDRAARAK